MSTSSYLSSFTQLPHVETEEERRALWRQSMATLARAALEQQPVPLEGIDPKLLLEAVRTAFKSHLIDDLDWLSASAAAAAVYELATAIPMGPERRQLGRQVLERLYEGDAEAFVVLATSLAAESRKTLTGPPIRARVALALELPIGSGVPSDSLALALISRHDLRREWLSDPATGSLPSRRLAARLLERAARESARRASQGDAGSLRAFQEPAVKTAWSQLIADRESLVWRHVAIARGLLCEHVRDYWDEIEAHLQHELTPTEWRRAVVSLSASIAVNPTRGLKRCRDVMADDTLRSDPGLVGTMIYGLARGGETEPEAAEELLNQIVRMGGLEAAEALVELRRERVGGEFGAWAARFTRDHLTRLLETQRIEDDGRVALCHALIDELSGDGSAELTLRNHLDAALLAFAEQDARKAFALAQQVFQQAVDKISLLEQSQQTTSEGRRMGFRAMRELDVALLETSTLCDLLNIGARGKGAPAATAPLGDLFERMTNWLLRQEARPVASRGAVQHITLRLRRMRSLLHLVDADGSYGEDMTGQRKERRMRIARVLLSRAREDATSPLRRIVCASLARACDALMRDEICELSDVIVAAADNVQGAHDLQTLAEASMMPDFQRSVTAYAEVVKATQNVEPTGRNTRAALDALRQLAQSLPWASTLRVSALRIGLLRYTNLLEHVAAVRAIATLAEGDERSSLQELEGNVYSLAQLTVGARRRLVVRKHRAVPASGSAISMLDMAVEQRYKDGTNTLGEMLKSVTSTLEQELPAAIANVAKVVLGRLPMMPLEETGGAIDSFVPPAPKEAPLPPWLPGRRIIGGFFVLRPLGTGGVGSVFVVNRAEERHQATALRFALKVPDYSAEAARTLSEEEFLNLFREEAGALLALPPQPNLATFVTFDAGARPKPILVMELVEGPTLERVIERGDLSLQQAIGVLLGVAEGLDSMHRLGLGHLDVKPSNVILRHSEFSGVSEASPVLVDFGLAGRQLRPGCATGPYGSPEIWGLVPEGCVPRPMAADTYAFACLAYEVLTGDTLFEAPGELATINMHLSHDGYPEKLLQLRQHEPFTAICDLLANALRQHPDDRISIAEIKHGLSELAPMLSDQPWPLRAA